MNIIDIFKTFKSKNHLEQFKRNIEDAAKEDTLAAEYEEILLDSFRLTSKTNAHTVYVSMTDEPDYEFIESMFLKLTNAERSENPILESMNLVFMQDLLPLSGKAEDDFTEKFKETNFFLTEITIKSLDEQSDYRFIHLEGGEIIMSFFGDSLIETEEAFDILSSFAKARFNLDTVLTDKELLQESTEGLNGISNS